MGEMVRTFFSLFRSVRCQTAKLVIFTLSSILGPSTSFRMKRLPKRKIVKLFIPRTGQQRRKMQHRETQEFISKDKDNELMDIAMQEERKHQVNKILLLSSPPAKELSSTERATQVLALYYVLYYNAEILHQSIEDRNKPLNRSSTKKGTERKEGMKKRLTDKGTRTKGSFDVLFTHFCILFPAYSGQLLELIPIKSLLAYVQAHTNDTYSNIYPPLLSLVVSQFPGLLTVSTLLIEEERNSRHLFLHSLLFVLHSPLSSHYS
jgi:hypothetical protein